MNFKKILSLLLLLACVPLCVSAQEATTVNGARITINIFGAVNKPSRYILPQDGTLLEALAAAGGPSKSADLKKVRIIHKAAGDKSDRVYVDVSQILNGDAKDAPLHDGDVIYFTELVINQ